ncbi:MAG: hypothetical protein QOD36_1762 [Mycobacterium sp.]|jgi:hypothetical protein|nr:hypothetical protein [Mycobacterium sp.]
MFTPMEESDRVPFISAAGAAGYRLIATPMR